MSLNGVMRTSVSGMNVQSDRLSTVADNVANVDTHGYKRVMSEFTTLNPHSHPNSYTSGGVESLARQTVSDQGNFEYTSQQTNLAVSGNGFFVVQGTGDETYLTRAGAFVPDGDGDLVNAAGFKLMGYGVSDGDPTLAVNSYSGLENVNIYNLSVVANPTTEGLFQVNLPSESEITPAADLPSANGATANPTGKSSIAAYDNLGNDVTLDTYFTKTADNTWEVAVYDAADKAPNSPNGFPYGAAPLTTETLSFNPADGSLDASSPTSLTIPVPGGQPLLLDMGSSSQLAADYTTIAAHVNGNAPSAVESVEISTDGTLYTMFENGSRIAAFKIPLATVPSPDNLSARPGNVYSVGLESGDVLIAQADTAGMGSIQSSALEQSNVDLGEELTNMIESQRSYTANSKVFQAGSELLDVLVNLKR